MLDPWLYLCLFVAIAVAYIAGRLSVKNKATEESVIARPSETTKHRLQLLFDSYSDEALDSFIHSLEVTPQTLPLHISIGKHFRTEGEVEKAIFIHQNLMSHPQLSKQQTEPVVYELAKDYKAAGLLDRAESLLEQLFSSRTFSYKSRKLLLDVLELEKDWEQAIEIGKRMELRKHPEVRMRLSQYCCELAEQQKREGDTQSAERFYQRAIGFDKRCVRAHLALAEFAYARGKPRTAILAIRDLLSVEPDFLRVALPLMKLCTKETDSYAQYRDFLQAFYHSSAHGDVVIAIYDSYLEQGEEEAGRRFLEQHVFEYPSLPALRMLMTSPTGDHLVESRQMWALIKQILDRIGDASPDFLCSSCGFTGQHMHWLCPSCKSWQTIKPHTEWALMAPSIN